MQSDRQEAKRRDQFKKLGREAVRDKLHARTSGCVLLPSPVWLSPSSAFWWCSD